MKKKHNSMLVPYYFKDNSLYIFLQRRTDDAPTNPNLLAVFGGGAENDENNEETLLREIQEELDYTPQNYSLFCMFEVNNCELYYYIEKVSEDFDKNIIVHEGKGGEWHKATDAINRDDITPNTYKVVSAMVVNLLPNKQKLFYLTKLTQSIFSYVNMIIF